MVDVVSNIRGTVSSFALNQRKELYLCRNAIPTDALLI